MDSRSGRDMLVDDIIEWDWPYIPDEYLSIACLVDEYPPPKCTERYLDPVVDHRAIYGSYHKAVRYWKCEHYPSAIDNYYSRDRCEHGCDKSEPRWFDHGFSVLTSDCAKVDMSLEEAAIAVQNALDIAHARNTKLLLNLLERHLIERRRNEDGCKTPSRS